MAKMIFTNQSTKEVFENGNITFEAFQELMKDAGLGKKIFDKEGKEVSTETASDKIRAKFCEVLGIEPGTKGKELRRAMRRHQVDLYEITEDVLVDLVKTGWGDDPFFDQFVEVKNGDEGDANEFYTEDNTILVVSELAGNHHNLFRQRLGEGEAYSVKTSWWGLKIYAEYERFLSGNVDWTKFIQKVYQAFDKKFNSLIYTVLGTAGSSLPAGGQWVKTAPLSSATKETFLQLVEDVKTANGTDVVIMGTKIALSKLVNLEDVNWISEAAKEARYTMGRVGYFEGNVLAEIPQVFADNDTTTRLVANDKLMIMPLADNKFIKVFNEGEARVREISDGNTNVDATMEYEYQLKMGVGIVIGRLFGIWNISSNVSA